MVVAIPPYQYLLTCLSGGTFETISALPYGYDPHTSEITPKDREKLEKAALWIGIGEFYEKKLLKTLLERNPHLKTLTLVPNSPLTSSPSEKSQEKVNLHFWLSLPELRSHLFVIVKTLEEIWPENRTLYQNDLHQLVTKIDMLERKTSKQLSLAAGRTILTSHESLGYFCRDYKMRELCLECLGKSPLPNQLLLVTKEIEKSPPICAIQVPSHSHKAIDLFAKKWKLPLYSVDLLSPNVFQTIENLSDKIEEALHETSN